MKYTEFKAAAFREVGRHGYTVIDKASDFRPPKKVPGFTKKMKQFPIENSNAVLVIVAEKLDGSSPDFDSMLVNGPSAMNLKLYAMEGPSEKSWDYMLES